MTILVLLSVLLQITYKIQAQETETADSPVPTDVEFSGRFFRLLWYHWLAIIIFCSLIILVIAPSVLCMIYCCKRTYTIRLAERNLGSTIPPGYVLERDLHKRLRDEVDGVQMTTLFNNIDGDYKEIDRADINITNRLGIGEFGPIFDAEVKLDINDIRRAMIKVFQQGTSQDLVRFREEVENLKHLEHPQVAQLFGVVSKSPYYIVSELTINGDLKTFLVMSGDKEDLEGNVVLPVPKLVAMASDVASGLSYLECMDYVHTDVAARNCLVTENLCVKITDFKVGRYLFRNEYAVQADGSLMPLRWMAPETILNNNFTMESSVWSFGVLLWEVMSRGSFPYTSLSDEEMANTVCHQQKTLSRPNKDCPDRVYKVMKECWSGDPYSRPHMSLVHKLLESSILTNKYDKSHVRLYTS